MTENKTLKILNLYAGIGGNRKLWSGNIEVTAVEIDEKIAKIYQDFFPNDKVIIADAHQFLLEHYKEFDFIWSSPPCPSHSRFNFLKMQQIESDYTGFNPQYPDMRLYQEIIFLSTWFNGKFVVENVVSYYTPLIKPQVCNNHFFWANFNLENIDKDKRGIRTEGIDYKQSRNGFVLDKYKISKRFKRQILNNCVKPEVGLSIFNMAFKEKQEVLLK